MKKLLLFLVSFVLLTSCNNHDEPTLPKQISPSDLDNSNLYYRDYLRSTNVNTDVPVYCSGRKQNYPLIVSELSSSIVKISDLIAYDNSKSILSGNFVGEFNLDNTNSRYKYITDSGTILKIVGDTLFLTRTATWFVPAEYFTFNGEKLTGDPVKFTKYVVLTCTRKK